MKTKNGKTHSWPKEMIAEVILWGGNILTMDSRKPKAQAVAIKGGRFLKVGRDVEIKALAGGKTKTIALKGRTVTPGFIDAHQHLSQVGTNLLQIDCNPKLCRSITHIQRVVQKEAERKPPGEWIRGVGYDDTKTNDQRLLNRWDLDEVSPDHPVFIQHVSGHWGVTNSKGLQAGGVGEDSPIRKEEPTGAILKPRS